MKFRAAIVFAVILTVMSGALVRPAAAQGDNRVSTVPIADLGYPDTISLPGVYPSFTFNVPVSSTLRSARLVLNLAVSPLADPQSSVQVTVNDVAVYAGYVGKIWAQRAPRRGPSRPRRSR